MSLYQDERSSFAISGDLSMSSKIEEKSNSETDEIAYLAEQIYKMERNYIQMEKFYAEKLKTLHLHLMEKDHEFKRLQMELMDMKQLGQQHRKKVEELTQMNQKPEPRIKSRSPVFKKSSQKVNANSGKVSSNDSGTLPRKKEADKKSPSPKAEDKKMSPTHRSPYQKPFFQRNQHGLNQPPNIGKNSSSERLPQKSISPKNSYEQKKAGSMKTLEVESMKTIKKTTKGLGYLKEKAPSFK